MKTLLLCLLALLPIVAFCQTPVVYQVNPAQSRLNWTGYAQVGNWAPTGTLQLLRGSFESDGRSFGKGRFEFDLRTIAHEQAQLAEHLRGPDFFDAARYPTAVFVLSEVSGGRARGQLTLKGVMKAITFPATVKLNPDGTLRVQGSVVLDRTQFGINYNSDSFFQNLGHSAIRNDFTLAFEVLATPAESK